MFQEPRSYPVLPQVVKNYLRQVNGVVLPKFIGEDQEVKVLKDIQAVQVGDKLIPIYSSVEDAWVDVVYDCWIDIGKVDSLEIGELATKRIQDNTWWRI